MPKQPRARSNYRQLRLTCTQEFGGAVSYSIYAKGLRDEWNEHHCLVRAQIRTDGSPLASTEDVISLLIDILEDNLLPRDSR